MSNVMLLSPLNDDGSNSLTSTPSAAMETDQSVYDLQKNMQQQQQQQRSAGGEFENCILPDYHRLNMNTMSIVLRLQL